MNLSVSDVSLALFLISIALVLGAFVVWSGRRSELESSLEKIRRDLEAKSESLNREREEHATLMSAISDAILAVDTEGASLFYNSRFALLFGGGLILEGRRARLWELFRNPEILEAFRHALREGRQTLIPAIALDQEGGRKFFSLSVSPLRRATGAEVYGAVGIFHDVSELKRAEQVRIDFVANVSHELRTPLTSITGYADTLRQDIEAGRAISKEFIEIIGRNADRLKSLIQDLLDLSSLESSADDLQGVAVDTREVSQRVLKHLEASVRAKSQSVELEARVPTVFADPGRLEQVLVNLLENASKYTPAGGRIRLIWDSDPKGEQVLMKVSDTGPGIPPEHVGRLFERFYRVDKARSRELGGTGLGLAIVKHILQRHGGSVSVESVVGKGSTFVCSFPSRPRPS